VMSSISLVAFVFVECGVAVVAELDGPAAATTVAMDDVAAS